MDRHTLFPPSGPPLYRADSADEHPDIAVAALPLFVRLRDELQAVVAAARSTRWGVPKLFFFDRALQTEWNAVRPGYEPLPPILTGLVDDARAVLTQSRRARHAARAVPGLRAAADAIAPTIPVIRELSDLFALADDAVIRVVCPITRTGYRVVVRGVADVWQFHVLLADAVTGDPRQGYMVGRRPHPRIVAECTDSQAKTEDDVFEARFQFFRPSALQAGGELPSGFGGSDHWVWGSEWVTELVPEAGERAVVLGEPVLRATWDVVRSVPRVCAEIRVIEVMSMSAVAEWIGDRTGQRPVWAESDAADRRAA